MTDYNVVEAEPEDGDLIYNANYTDEDDGVDIPPYCVFHNYRSVHARVCHLTERSYEMPNKWYFIVFAPFNKNYEKDIKFYLNNGLDHVRKKLGKVKCLIMTREISAKKVHINVLCCTSRALDQELKDQKTNKYSIYCKKAIDRRKALVYILKEARTRYFHEYIDYQYTKTL